MAERSIAAVLKTVEGNTSGGSNPSLSASLVIAPAALLRVFCLERMGRACSDQIWKTKNEGGASRLKVQ
jgi:hypothetical protein